MKERLETQAENESTTWLKAAFEQNVLLSAGGDFLKKFRHQQFDQFVRRGLPSRREEAWKYTDLSFLEKNTFTWPQPLKQPWAARSELKKQLAQRAKENILMVFVNGQFAPALSKLASLPEGFILSSLQQALQTQASRLLPYLLRELDAHRYPLACLNDALFSDGLFLYMPPGAVLEKPLHVLSLAVGGQRFMTQPRHVIILEKDTQLSLTEEYLSDDAEAYLTNARLDCFIGKNASLNYYKVQNETMSAKHFATAFFHQKQNSSLNACSFAVGGQFSRNDWFLALQEPQAACRVRGFYGLDADGQLMDHHLYIDHAAPHTQSEMDFRGVLAKQSRAVFNGKVHVRPEAKKTQAQQLNHNLLLSPLAEIDTKPELEIYADEVQCRHGATVGQLDEETLFYLRTRGLDRQTATTILLQGFVEAVLSEVTLPWLVEELHQLWGRHLEAL